MSYNWPNFMHQNHADFYGFFIPKRNNFEWKWLYFRYASLFSTASYHKLILLLSRGCISAVAWMEISFWKAHEILCDERNYININQLFFEWLEKLNHYRQSYSNTFLNCMILGHSECSVELILSLEKGRQDPFQQMCSDFFSLLWDKPGGAR